MPANVATGQCAMSANLLTRLRVVKRRRSRWSAKPPRTCREAVQVIHAALDQGVNYCDTAPAYDGSMDYYGAALGERRAEVFLASKTHDRTRDGSLRLLDSSLQRLRTEHLDL